TDSINVRSKNQTWELITSQYNCRSETGSRTVQQLKTVYDMAKRQTKKIASNNKVTMYRIAKQISHEEQSLIVDLVQSHHSELFTGQKYQRDGAWLNIMETYNLHQITGPREVEELKYIFENLSKAAKIENSMDKIGRYKTGGGTYANSMSSISEQILGVIGERIEPLENIYDDDANYITTENVEVIVDDNGEELLTINDLDYTGRNKTNWDWSSTNDILETTNISPQSMTNDAAINESNNESFSSPIITKNRSSQKKICDSLQELTQNKKGQIRLTSSRNNLRNS
ncbi:Myb DNA-bind 5 domain-containing protein, partial [Aphis craccivora]